MQLSSRYLIVICCLFLAKPAIPQDSTKVNDLKNAIFIASTSAIYSGTMSLLYKSWYKQYPSEAFHFFNDSKEWRGMDKIGHFTSTWWSSQWMYTSLKVSGFSEKRSLFWATFVPLTFMTTVEVFDGFSSEWGFSPADMIANVSGSGLFLAQQHFLGDQFIQLKYSYHSSGLASIRPNLLGSSLPSKMLKDYNAQTYWLSFPIKSIIAPHSERFPPWLCLSVGYGAGGMLGGHSNVWKNQTKEITYDYSHVKRYSEYYLSFDIDVRKLPIKGKLWRIFSSTIAWIKIPAPSLHWMPHQGFDVHPVYW